MKAIKFPEANHEFKTEEEEFEAIPVLVVPRHGTILYCFELSEEDKAEVAKTGVIWFSQMTQGQMMQPIFPTAFKKDVILPTEPPANPL
jgi:hypothetical protein